MELTHLKSGTDIRGTAIDIADKPMELTDEVVAKITYGFCLFLKKMYNKSDIKVAIGHDCRISSERIYSACSVTLKSYASEVYMCSLASTPSMFMMTKYKDTDCDGAIMITASHHPYDKNGLKFFTRFGGINGGELNSIIALSGEEYSQKNNHVITKKHDFMSLYTSGLVAFVREATGTQHPLTGLKIVVDAGNGVGGFFCERVLEPLGADTTGSQFLEPDGMFPNHIPNPENESAMDAIVGCVKANHADLGIIFDTDVDRAGIVGSDGTEINRNRLIALISDILLSEYPGGVIVTDSITSDGLHDFILGLGGKHVRFRRGYNNVITEGKRIEASGEIVPIAIETSGHAALRENYFLDDGAYLVTRILITLAIDRRNGRNILERLESLRCPSDEAEIRLTFDSDNWAEVGRQAIDTLTEYSQRNCEIRSTNYEGIRANLPELQGWFLARMSVHDPVLPINIESDLSNGCKAIANVILSVLEGIEGLNCDNLIKFCS